MVGEMPRNASVGLADQCTIEKLNRYTEFVSLMGQVSNIIVALELHRKKQNEERMRIYAERFLQAVEGERRIQALKGLLESSERVKLPADFDEKMPAVIEALKEIRKGEGPRDEIISNVKAFLTTFEENLITLVEEQEGTYFEPWQLGERL